MPSPASHSRRLSGAPDSSAKGRGRVSKRSGNACSRCRKQKIKCSGSQPCDACQKRKLSCEFDERDQKILVTRGYIIDLQQRVENQRRTEGLEYVTPGSLESSHEVGRPVDDGDVAATSFREEDSIVIPSIDRPESDSQSSNSRSRLDPVASTLTNPLSTGQSKFMTSAEGQTYYLGTSSNWSFGRRVLSLTHEYVYHTPVSTGTLLFDGTAYDLGWDGSRTTVPPEAHPLPSLDHAIYLINTVKFHCSQVFHLFDEESFMKYMYDFYSDPINQKTGSDLRYIQLLLILAFGKALVENNYQAKKPPGAEYFLRALRLLPSTHALVQETILSTEVLCCIALYFQCLDYRNSAHNFIGQAIRIALLQGMHTDMPRQHLGDHLVERSRKAWWTAYVLDREMTSLMGLPQSINDDDVHPSLPHFSGSSHRIAALNMQIRLSRTIAAINRGVYGADGRLNKKFLLSTKDVLSNIATLADELQETFPMQVDQTINGVSRTSGYLHLLYHQCIVLATRPLLFCFLKIRFESPASYLDTLNSSQTVWNLIKMCMDSSQQMINILSCLQSQGLLETFLPFDLEPLFVSSLTLLLGPVLNPRLLENESLWRQKSHTIFNEMVGKGNLIAEFRQSELQQLDDMLRRLPATTGQSPTPNNPDQEIVDNPVAPGMDDSAVDTTIAGSNDEETLSSLLPGMEEYSTDVWLTTAQIIDMANSIANSDTEWVSHTITEHDIW
ncbi:positive activator of transcription [Ilyonectria robusta]